jgi:hypothetical protein
MKRTGYCYVIVVYYRKHTKYIFRLCEIMKNFLILKQMLHNCVVTIVLEIFRQHSTLIEINFEIRHIALALILINLHSVCS